MQIEIEVLFRTLHFVSVVHYCHTSQYKRLFKKLKKKRVHV